MGRPWSLGPIPQCYILQNYNQQYKSKRGKDWGFRTKGVVSIRWRNVYQ